MARRPLLSPFSPRFSRFFDEFRDLDLERPFFQRPYWVDYQFEDAHKLGSGIGEVIDDDEHYSVTIDVSQFAPEDLKVSISDRIVIIEGKHPMIKDQFGEIERQFTRRLMLPKDTKPELVSSELTKDGKLTVQIPKKEKNQAQARTIPIFRKE
uniref:SHSP domain-containing protein n=1 Tax=Elaeophora elaphi TaxID=1147741 RepID=A0A0R3RYS5_9BILA